MAKERRRKAEEAATAAKARGSATIKKNQTTARNPKAASATQSLNASKVSGRTQPRAHLMEIEEVQEE
jgi:hypothetical protein